MTVRSRLPGTADPAARMPRALAGPRAAARGRIEGRHLLVGLLIAWGVSLLLGLAVPLAGGRVYINKDLGNYHLPQRAFYADCLASGDAFWWSPRVWCGYYIHGEGQNGMFHPLRLALYGTLPLRVAFNLEFLASYPALLFGTFLFLRGWGLPRASALLGGLVFSFAGYNVSNFSNMHSVAVVAHVPWLLLGIDRLLRRPAEPGRVAWARLAVVLLTTSQILLGHPQSALFSLLLEAGYALGLAWSDPGARRRLFGLVAAKLLGLLGGGVQVIPTLEALGGSHRARPTPEFLAIGSLPTANLLQWVAPYLYVSRVLAPATTLLGAPMPPAETLNDFRAHAFVLYNGAVVPALLCWLLARWRGLPGRTRRLAAVLLAPAAVALVIALGDYTPAFRLTTRVPVLNAFRVPSRFLVVVHFATAVLAALAFADLCRHVRRPERPRRVGLWALGVLALAGAVVGLGAGPLARVWPETLMRPYLAPLEYRLLGVLLVTLAAGLVALAARGSRRALFGIVLLAAADQALYSISFVVRESPGSPAALASLTDPEELPPGAEGMRVHTRMDRSRRFVTLRGATDAAGIVGLFPPRLLDTRKTVCLRVAGVSWSWEKDASGAGRWVRVPDPLPRARLVTKAVESVYPDFDIDHIDVRTTALIDRAVPPLVGEPGTARIEQDRPGRIEVVTDAPGRQLLVLNESYHDGWRATIDGRSIPTARVNGDFLGCLAPEGRHRIRLRFEPWSLRAGLWSSAVGLSMALVFTLAPLRVGRRGRIRPDVRA